MCLTRLVNKIRSNMAKADPKDFILNTDYEMDKIIYYTEGEITPGSTNFIMVDNLSFVPLLFGNCAFNSDFSDSRMSPYVQWVDNGQIEFQYWAGLSSGRVFIGIRYNNTENANKKLYFRLYGFEPSNSTTKTPKTSKLSKKFILNTDYNYCKLYKKGVVSGDAEIEHNLGYIPFVLAWNGTPYTTQHWMNYSDSYVTVTTKKVVIKSSGTTHYRIYYDEA